ncbi:cytoplasmic exosome RNAse DIS3L/RPR44 [Acrasis kona]|uniref:DIS3-like exonuclease 1 n=1 Tax=Acrasis kona TaxID=1008807 RepID=A0AAW2ZRJ2_9EUKA
MNNKKEDQVKKVKAFSKLNKKGNVVRVIREHYLRDDIWCKSLACNICRHEDAVLEAPEIVTKMSKTALKKQKKKAPEMPEVSDYIPQYIIPSVDVSMKYLDILEECQKKNIIFCETVSEEANQTQHSQKRKYQRIRNLINNQERCSILFANEHSVETYTDRLESESQKQRNDRAVVIVSEWYSKHLNNSIPIILLSDTPVTVDPNNNITVMSMVEFVQGNTKLMDMLANVVDSTSEVNLFEEHLPLDVMESGISKGTLHRAKIKMSRKEDATVRVDGEEYIVEPNRAVHDDVVCVQILPKEQWRVPNSKRVSTGFVVPTAVVVGVIQRNWRDYVCSILESNDSSSNVMCVPLDYRIPKIRIRTNNKQALENMRIVVRISSWERGSNYPTGFYVKTIGPIGDLNVETQSLLLENQIHITPFSKAALDQLPSKDWKPDPRYRKDLRTSHMVSSIDPIGCEDIDDALSVRHLPNDCVEIGVHIADVTAFVPHDSPLDIEARNKSTTIYLIDRRIDMLPSLLSANLCSLHQNRDRYAMSVIWKFNNKHQVIDTWFGRTVIRNRYALHYDQAQSIIDGISIPKVDPIPERNWSEAQIAPDDFSQLKKNLTTLQKLGQLLHRARQDNGAVDLESLDQVTFSLDDKKEPTKISTKVDGLIHHTVAEWMIYANAAVAKKIHDHNQSSALLRIHPQPKSENFSSLLKVASVRDYAINVRDNNTLAKSLDGAVDRSDPYVNMLLRSLATRAMEEAQYVSSGSLTGSEALRHYGLALQHYTHFTSPIRRYADIIVHRQLLNCLQNENHASRELFNNQQLQKIASAINDRKRAADRAQQESTEWFRAIYFRNKSQVVDGIVFGVKSTSISVFLPQYYIKGQIYLTTREGQLIIPIKERNRFELPENIPSAGVIDYHEEKQRVGISIKGSLFKITVFDHVQVQVKISESKAHLPQVSLELTTFKTSTKPSAGASGGCQTIVFARLRGDHKGQIQRWTESKMK